MGKLTKQLFGLPVVSQRCINRGIEETEVLSLATTADDGCPSAGIFKKISSLVAARIVAVLALIVVIANRSIPQVLAAVVQRIVVFMIDNPKLRAKQPMHFYSTTAPATPSIVGLHVLTPVGVPIPLQQPLEIGGINNRILSLRESDKTVGWVERLSNCVTFHAARVYTFGHGSYLHRNLRFGLYLIIFGLLAVPCLGQTTVSPSPFVVPQYFTSSGQPCSGCKLASFAAGSSTPLVTYSEPSGTFPNSNPVVLDSAGRARIYLTGAAYKLVLSTATGSQIWSVDNVAGSTNSLLAQNNVWTGTQTFQATSNFNAPVNLNVGFTSLGPNTLNGGGTIAGSWGGSPVFTGTPHFSGMPIFDDGFSVNGTATFNGQIASTLATGTAPFIISSQTEVPNLNANFLEGGTWETPLNIGSTTPMNGTFTGLHATTNFQIASSVLIGGIKGTDSNLLSAGTVAAGAGNAFCTDANGGATTSGCNGFSQIEVVKKTSSTCAITGGASYQTCSDTLTWPVAFADAGYVVTCTGVDPSAAGTGTGNQSEVLIINSYNASTVTVLTQQNRGGGPNANFTEIHCQGIHP
jgi:hypothetical protein